MKIHYLLITALALFFCFCEEIPEKWIEIKYGSINGVVTDERGVPIQGVIVTVDDEEVMTNSEVFFSIDKIMTGERVVTFSKYHCLSISECYRGK